MRSRSPSPLKRSGVDAGGGARARRAAPFLLLACLAMLGANAGRPAKAQPTSDEPRGAESAPPEPDANAYVGSPACAQCHTGLYVSWRKTRHSYSIITAEEAQRAGYPLPKRRVGGEALTIRTWQDVRSVIGGRQRIAYADRQGRVIDTAYHHRLGTWRSFPAKPMDCEPCHVTGPRRDAQADGAAGWAELNIGCEACHGPGARHVRSLRKEDIVVDPTSRLCGRCHTAVGRALPQDDLHQGHDLIQTWNRDPHTTGVRSHSHSAFCARCHSPFQRELLEPDKEAAKRVFSEEKKPITCIACHDPHDVTNASYQRDRVRLAPPLPPKFQVFRGADGDFATPDYTELRSNEELCVQCHRGADRIDLDHADATCSDCHNAFRRNRSIESRPFQDANHRALSCRPCHRDADHLISILFRDPDFLQPKYVHNLNTLPAAVVRKYGFRYPGLRRTVVVRRPSEPPAVSPVPQDGLTAPRPDPASTAVRALLAQEPHTRLAADAEIRKLQSALAKRPGELGLHLALALAYADRGAQDAAVAVIEGAASLDSSWLLVELPLDPETGRVGDGTPEGIALRGDGAAEGATRRVAERLFPPSLGLREEPLRLWVQAYLLMTEGRFIRASELLETARQLDRQAPYLAFSRAVAEIGGGHYDEALDILEVATASDAEALALRTALALTNLKRRRFERAREDLEHVLRSRPGDPVAAYLLAQSYLLQKRPAEAADALRLSLASDPEFLDAAFALARAYRLAGNRDAAADIYAQISKQHPRSFAAHHERAKLFKLISDELQFIHRSRVETAPPPGVTAEQWRAGLVALERQASDYEGRALNELAQALRLRPLDYDLIRQVAEIYRRSGRLDEALPLFSWLERRESEAWVYPYRRGAILLELGRDHEAVEALQRALALAPENGDVYFALALAYARTGRTADAIGASRRGLVFEPFNPALHTNLAATLAAAGELDLARQSLQRAVELATFPLPRLHLTYTDLAVVDVRQGRLVEAVQQLRNALHVFPGDERAQRLLAAVTGPGVNDADLRGTDFVFNDLVEIFGEVTTVAFDNE